MPATQRMKPILFCLLYVICSCSKEPSAGITSDTTKEYSIAPAQTDPQIDMALSNHFVSVKTSSSLKNILFVFLPGSYATPAQYKGIVRKAAELGYHSIGLMYPDDIPVNNFCAETNDTTCHRRARMEIVDGVDRSANIHVNRPNSIINRLQKLLLYLKKNHPEENWGQFLDGDSVKWNSVIMAGHSQGGGNAAVMGRYYPLRRIIMFSMMDWMNNGKVPDWINMTFNNGNYFELYNPSDEIIRYNVAKSGWTKMGMTSLSNPAVNSDSFPLPYHHAKVLLTSYNPADSAGPKYHNSTVMDVYVARDGTGNFLLDKQWEYLIDE